MATPGFRRPLVGPLMMVVGVVHVAITPVLFPASVTSIIEAGVVDAVESDPDLTELRGIAFWYATAGLGLIFTGWAVQELERRDGGAPPTLPFLLAGLGTWGAVLMPRSPFWAFIALAALAVARHDRPRRRST